MVEPRECASVESIIEEARRRIEEGRETFATGGRVEPAHFSTIEYYVVYQAAIDILLREGYIDRTSPEIRAAFFDLIPEPKEYTDEADTFEGLVSQDSNRRVAAAKRFSSLALKSWSVYRKFLYQYPRTFDRLLLALNDDEPGVVENAVRALCVGSERYFADPRVFEAILPLFSHSDGAVLLATVVFTSRFTDDRKFEPLFRILTKRVNQPLLRGICRHFESGAPAAHVISAQPILLEALKRKLNAETRNTVLATLVKSLNPQTIASFKGLVSLPHDAAFEAELRRSMAIECTADERAWLERQLW